MDKGRHFKRFMSEAVDRLGLLDPGLLGARCKVDIW